MNKEELRFILEEGEGLKIEFKESLNNIDKEMVAFANAEGGRIFLGISDNSQLKGIKIDNKLKSQIQDMARNCDPSIQVNFEKFKNILIISVDEGKDKPYKCSSGFYVRQGSNSQKMKRDEILEFAVKVSKVFFDELPCEKFDIKKDFDNAKLEAFLKMAKISDVFNKEDALVNLNLAKKGKNKLIINNTGAMLFAKNLSSIFYHTTVTCVRFKGSDRATVLDRKDFNEDIISNIENSVRFVLQYLPLRYEIKGLHRKEYYEIPEDAVREAVVNAVVHRDYFQKGANVQINIFEDRMEVTNPGGLVAGLKKEDFGKRSMTRNPLMLSTLSKTELVEKIGSGIKRIRNALKEKGLKKPIFKFNGFFTVTFLRVATTPQTTPQTTPKTEELIIGLIKENPSITKEEISKQLNLTIDGVKYHIKKLRKEKGIAWKGPSKKGNWEVVK